MKSMNRCVCSPSRLISSLEGELVLFCVATIDPGAVVHNFEHFAPGNEPMYTPPRVRAAHVSLLSGGGGGGTLASCPLSDCLRKTVVIPGLSAV